ncbi:peptidase domain-containing ABC transporter [Vibrio aestuarianus]|uniref:peptidase domain-containing ABC transporter n=1 Tax=Vibrio aestuarianus TaxID=28171 RepID=UPI00237C6824|nr:peptidase domain-containing ABC transporter [Vibrio aestuarianus]MDE1329479.1 peptidase domain-containing ABC transporter [Vibrio aestuarianus]
MSKAVSNDVIKESDEVLSLLSYSGKRRVPLIFQAEVAECGLACIAMISSYYGYQVNIPPLRKKSALDSNGMNLKQLIELADQLNLSCRALQCSLEEIGDLKLPCILHWDMQHFVVLTGVTKNKIYINDPASGKRKLSLADFSNSFTGIALELTPTNFFKKDDKRVVMKINQLWQNITGLKSSLITLFSLSLILQIITLLSPYYMQWVIDNVLLSNDEPLLTVLAVGFIILIVIKTIVSSLRSWIVLRFSSSLNLQIGANLFRHLLKLPMSYFEKRHIGDIVSRFGSLSTIREMLTKELIETVIDGLMASIVLIMMFLYNTKLAILVISIVFISFLIKLGFYFPNRRLSEESIAASAKEDTTFLESIRAIQTIKLFSHESNRQNIWLNKFSEVINADIRLAKIEITESAINDMLFGIETILVIYFGALIVMEGELTIGMLLAFIAYKSQFVNSIMNFIDKILSFKLIGLHVERVSDIALELEEAYHGQNILNSSILSGELQLENITFKYSDNSENIIDDISLHIKQGESVAIIGSSGCGKTTLLKIILGLLKPTSGRILLDGVDVTNLGLNEYRQLFGSVMQNDTLMSGTVAENIVLFDPNFDEERLYECCRLACILDDIKSLPMGFESLVGDMGNNFSGGQLQRIFLARALYKKPKILCLDESTSHLDQNNELMVNDNIKKMKLTKIIVAHRKETIESVDRVYKLN